MKYVGIGILLIVGIGGIIFVTNQKPIQQNTPSQTVPTSQEKTTQANRTTLYSPEEISKHNKETDCWTIVNNKVYNLTSFIAKNQHPPAIIQSCGTDGTTLFETRGEKNMPHDPQAQDVLGTMQIGALSAN